MAITGNLVNMGLPTLVQSLIQESAKACIKLEQNGSGGLIYVGNGQVHHAEHSSDRHAAPSHMGSEAMFRLLNWKEGNFTIDFFKDLNQFPSKTIHQDWSYLLMEGLRKIDEYQATEFEEANEDSLEDLISGLSDTDAAMIKKLVASQQKEDSIMSNLETTLDSIMNIDGAIAAALVDWQSGLTLGVRSNKNFNIDLAAAGNTNVIRAKFDVMKDLKISGGIEDILISLSDQYHLIRMMESNPNLFIYLALERSQANLGLARHHLSKLEKELTI